MGDVWGDYWGRVRGEWVGWDVGEGRDRKRWRESGRRD